MPKGPKDRAEVTALLLETAFPHVAAWLQLYRRSSNEAPVEPPTEPQLAAFHAYANKVRTMTDGELFVEKQLVEAQAIAASTLPDSVDSANWKIKGLDNDERSYWANTLAEWDEAEAEFLEAEAKAAAETSSSQGLRSELVAARQRIRELEERNLHEQAKAHEYALHLRRRVEDLHGALAESVGVLARLEDQLEKERKAAVAAKAGTVHPKLRTTFEKLLLGMAIDKFKYQLGQSGSVPENIRSALLRAGIKLDVKTIRERLTDAARKFEEEDWG
ncbi:MAG: hypothetical protein R3C46_14180 [Hyphomonadaceae bacterium]